MAPEGSEGGASESARIAVVVLTHNARQSLQRCLMALGRQTARPGAILITDNASVESPDDLVSAIETATVTRLPENLGPAGGYAAALTQFLESGYEWAWVMDDDCVPAPEALATQMKLSAPERVVLATVTWAETGEIVRGHGWWCALIPRRIVEQVGVPNAELFWWTEDTEYLQWRIPQAGFEVVWTELPIAEVSRARADASKPAWKYYYEARNQVFHRLHVQRAASSPPPENLLLRVRAWRAARSVGKLAVRAATREHDHRATKIAMVFRGTFDGLLGRLGHTVSADDSDRPTFTEEAGTNHSEPIP